MSDLHYKDTQEALGRNIKSGRKRLNYSQAKLAEIVGVSVPFIGDIEIGKKSPSLEMLCKIALALKVEPYELLIRNTDYPELIKNLITDELISEATDSFRSVLEKYSLDSKKN